ncbi:MAG: TIGR04283 family arsenosugar biosynthesis glycosyltransferase [Candidatus Eremiobacteraeota bacterium]|nr:TIGR04283 family arsenosugar biosynthesis glycosyltransferase [Candidatus Eremiobacteraeota bacterium]
MNEARNVRVRAHEIVRQQGPWEWIVADGGSDDDTISAARDVGAFAMRASRGRGPQMNAGASAARGEILLFLHADSTLPDGAFSAIRAALRDPRAVGGNFALRFDDDGFGGRLLAGVYALKQRLFGIWYGDSATFVRRDAFATLGGFGDVPILEDISFVERLRCHGATVRLPLAMTSSARRYRGRLLRTILRWTAIFALYKLGVAPQRLARFYPPHRALPSQEAT